MKLKDPKLLKQACYVGGKWSEALNGQTSPVVNPSTGKVIASVPVLGRDETLSAIHTAELVQKQWQKKTAKHRSQVLRRWFELVTEHSDDLATLLTSEQGKPFAEAKGEIAYAASFIEWFAEEAKRAYGEMIPSHKEDARILVSKVPVGVVGAITPWNFPAAMITRKCGPAFAAGCAVVLKPAPETPLTALALAELAERAGIPQGLFSVLTGDAAAIGSALTESAVVRKISFTGSTAVGKLLMAQSADTVKKLALELGGNAPFIVCDDADLEAAVNGVMIAKFRNAGQTCVCANRIYVQNSVYDAFSQLLVERVSQLKVGDGFAPDVTIGPLINEAAASKVQNHVDDAVAKGAVIAHGEPRNEGSLFVAPHVLLEANDDMLIATEETFGPVAALFRFDDDEDVIGRANHTESGLAAYAYTRDLARAFRFSESLEYGMVGINEGLISTEVAPFGGVKSSGLGREGARQGLDDYLETKYTLMGGLF